MSDTPSGPGAAAFLAAGIGSTALGAMIVVSEALPAFKSWLNWWAPAGPLTGKVALAMAAWAASWSILHALWRRREVPLCAVAIAGSALVALGFLLTFPPVYEALTRHA